MLMTEQHPVFELISEIYDMDTPSRVCALIIGAPNTGKTTMLDSLTKLVSENGRPNIVLSHDDVFGSLKTLSRDEQNAINYDPHTVLQFYPDLALDMVEVWTAKLKALFNNPKSNGLYIHVWPEWLGLLPLPRSVGMSIYQIFVTTREYDDWRESCIKRYEEPLRSKILGGSPPLAWITRAQELSCLFPLCTGVCSLEWAVTDPAYRAKAASFTLAVSVYGIHLLNCCEFNTSIDHGDESFDPSLFDGHEDDDIGDVGP